ncbi:MAG TPA: zinc ABC transporter substrate-binding protein [Anaerolineae bacterium]|jgi:zinc/manganese transport system substrate-binding protein
MNRVLFLYLAALTLVVSGCTAVPAPAAPKGVQRRPMVMATFSILGDMVHHIGGDLVDLKTLVGPGSDVHEFEPSPSDALNMRNADVIVENGLGLESWLNRLYVSSGSQARRVAASNGIPVRSRTANGNTESDPHVWQDVHNAISMTLTIRDALADADPVHASAYQSNAASYIVQLQTVDHDIQTEVNRLPMASRKLVTSHDALGYFAARYGFEITGSLLGTVATASGDPSAKEFAQLVRDIKAAGVRAVFVESVTNKDAMDRLAQEAGVIVGPELYTDSLGETGSEGATYISAMSHNAHAIVSALLGP